MGAVMSPAEIASKREQMRRRLLKLRDPEAYRVEVLARKRLRERNKHPHQEKIRDFEAEPPGRLRVYPSDLPELTPYDERRLWQKVRRSAPDACWPWQAAKAAKGYGRFKVGGKLYSPHRLVYALAHGPIRNVAETHGSVVMHACDNPACCNPAHLSLGRQQNNVNDMDAKGRRRRPTCSALPASAGRD